MNKIAVIGSGVMGSGIAAHIANSGTAVLMLDMVPPNAENRNILAESAVLRMAENAPSPFSLAENAKLITCGNMEDHLHLLKHVEWIIEAVVEKLEVKQDIYRKLDLVRKQGSILSSNTSTLPLYQLTSNMPESLQRDMLITHFFNPPRSMRLLELVAHDKTDRNHISKIEAFADIRLGKTVIRAKDTPGFIANRIGIFWIIAALVQALRLGIKVEEADSVLGKPAGIPKTGAFGLMDLVGIDLMIMMAKSLTGSLPESDAFRSLYHEPALLKHMVVEGYTGRKGKGGFYRVSKQDGKVLKEAMDLATGQYRPQEEPLLTSRNAPNFRALLSASDKGGLYAWEVFSETLSYAASLVPEIADSVVDVDSAMKLGFNWKYGPFELIDQLGTNWFKDRLAVEGRPIPPLLDAIGSECSLYQERKYFTFGGYTPLPSRPDAWTLAEHTYGLTPVLQNPSACLWDIGDGIACLEIPTKMHVIDMDVLTLLEASIDTVGAHFSGLVIGNDNEHFSAGLNLNLVVEALEKHDLAAVSNIIKHGQRTLLKLKYAPFPVVVATTGLVLGGACEMLLHADAAQAHIDSIIGLVETDIGLIPGWGGCTAMLLRYVQEAAAPDEIMDGVFTVFERIAFARKTTSAEEARKALLLNDQSHITMNRTRLLPDAKALCLSLAESYQPPAPRALHLPGKTIQAALAMTLYGLKQHNQISAHDEKVLSQLVSILSAGGADMGQAITEAQLMELEHTAFMRLVATEQTFERITYTLKTGKPLRN